MAKLLWDQVGSRFYEAGVDRGVLYTTSGKGVAWNGLTSVSETPSGGEPTPYYLDGIKYLSIPGTEEFGGSIEAFTYPDEFAEHDGTAVVSGGLFIHQQRRKTFGLAYRTGVGNDVDGQEHGYKLHMIYNALAAPSEKGYSTISDSPEALTFTWDFTTTAASASGYRPVSHLVVDSTKAYQSLMEKLERILYGTDDVNPRLPTVDEVIELVKNHTPTGYGEGPYGVIAYGGTI